MGIGDVKSVTLIKKKKKWGRGRGRKVLSLRKLDSCKM